MKIASLGPLGRDPKRALGALALVLLLALCVATLKAMDDAGWIPHKRATSVYLGTGNWVAGEYRNCVALPERDGSVFFLGCTAGHAADAGPQILPVTYWGKIRRPDMFQAVLSDPGTNDWKWLCRRQRNSVTCWALN